MVLNFPRLKSKPGLPFKVFIASPSDVNDVRWAANTFFRNKNENVFNHYGITPYWIYMWERNKSAKFLGPNKNTYQKQVFKEFGDWCDIFIIIVGKKYGLGTEKEYKHFIKTFRKANPECEFYFFSSTEISQQVGYREPELTDFIDRIKKLISPLGNIREGIKSVDEFNYWLEKENYKFIKSNLIALKHKL